MLYQSCSPFNQIKTILVYGCAILALSCSTSDNIDIKKYPIVTTIDELAEYYDLEIDRSGKYENTTITKYFDGSSELDYSYELLDSERHDQLFYSIIIEKERTIKDAREVYGLGKGALKLVGNSFDQGTIEIDSVQLPGDDSYYALRTFEGEPNGMFFIVRKEKRIFTMILSGIYTPDHSLIKDLLIPKISNLEEFEIINE